MGIAIKKETKKKVLDKKLPVCFFKKKMETFQVRKKNILRFPKKDCFMEKIKNKKGMYD